MLVLVSTWYRGCCWWECANNQIFVSNCIFSLLNVFYSVPSFKIYDHADAHLYTMHPPTCLGGICVNCCAEGNPCGKGCCKQSFRLYDPSTTNTDGDAPYLGQIMKKPKSAMVEIFTEADAFEVDFPKDATVDQKGILIGTSVFLNAVFFEGDEGGGGGG